MSPDQVCGCIECRTKRRITKSLVSASKATLDDLADRLRCTLFLVELLSVNLGDKIVAAQIVGSLGAIVMVVAQMACLFPWVDCKCSNKAEDAA